MILEFGEFEIDPRIFEIRRAGEPLAIGPKAFDLLSYLVENRDRVVSKQELLSSVWEEEFVSEAALTNCMKTLRQALGDSGAGQEIIKTVRGRGYRFIAPIEARLGGAPPPQAETAGLRSRLVGRRAEVEQLGHAFDAVCRGRGSVTLLVGDAGIGKTRMITEIVDAAVERGALSFVGRAHESGGAPAYWIWVEALRPYIAQADPDDLVSLMGPGAPEISELVPMAAANRLPAQATAFEPEQARYRMFDSVTTFLTNVARRAPLVLVLEDLHWADKPSLLLLQFLAREIAGVPIWVVATYRDSEINERHPLSFTLAALRREAQLERIVLGGLDRDEVGALVREWSDGEVGDELVDTLVRTTEGNPLFVLEMLQHWREEGVIDAEPIDGAGLSVSIPQGILEVIGRRLDRLSAECRRVLTVAAVLGHEFDYRVLAPVVDCGDEALIEHLDEASAARLVTELPVTVGRYSFTHSLIREVLYRRLSGLRRSRLHGRVGATLERLYAEDDEPHLAELAHHHLESADLGDVDKAAHYAARAGDRAIRLLAYEDAVFYLQSRVRVCERAVPPDSAEVCRALIALGDAQGKAGKTSQQHEAFGGAAAIARRLGLPELFSAAALGFGGRHLREFGTVDERAVALIEEALTALGDGAVPRRAQLFARLALSLRHAPETARKRRELSREAVDLARRHGDPSVLASVLDDALWAQWWPDNLDFRLAAAQELLAIAGDTGEREMELRAHGWRVATLLEAGDAAGLESEIARHSELADELRLPLYRWDTLNFRGAWSFQRGDIVRAERYAFESFAAGRKVHEHNADQIHAVQLGLARVAQLRSAEIFDNLTALTAYHPTCWRCGLLFGYAEEGMRDEASEQLEWLAYDDFARLPVDSVWLAGLCHLSIAVAFLGDVPRADVLYERLLPFRAQHAVISEYALAGIGSIERYLGLLAATLGAPERASDHFRRAIAANAKAQARLELIRTRLDYADMLLGRGNAAGATDLLERSESEAQSLAFAAGERHAARVRRRLRSA